MSLIKYLSFSLIGVKLECFGWVVKHKLSLNESFKTTLIMTWLLPIVDSGEQEFR